jgi:hypothetical protein
MTAVWHRVMDAWNDRDFGRMTSLLTEDAVLRTDPDWPGGGLVARDEVFLSHEDALSRARDAS